MSWSAIVSAIAGLIGVIRDFLSWKKAEDAKQAGEDALAAKINKETADAQERMAGVNGKPSDDDVVDRMQSGRF